MTKERFSSSGNVTVEIIPPSEAIQKMGYALGKHSREINMQTGHWSKLWKRWELDRESEDFERIRELDALSLAAKPIN